MYDAIVFSSGGVKGISHLGALAALRRHQRRNIEKCTHFVGSSAGAIAAATSAMNTDPERMFLDTVLPFEYKEKLLSREKNTMLDEFLDKLIPESVTFRDVFTETGNVLSIVSTNVSRRRAEIFDPFTSPTLSVRTALSASCAVPFVFPSVEIDGDIFVDGGVANPFPTDIARERYGKKKILGIALKENEQQKFSGSGRNLFALIIDLLMWTKISRDDPPAGSKIVEISTKLDVTPLDFDATELQKIELFFSGYRAFIDNKNLV